jgi:hypothetical protein
MMARYGRARGGHCRRQPGLSHQDFDQACVSANVLAKTMGDLEDSTGRAAAIPPRARDAQAIPDW